jgi:hypothetical protein
LCKQDVNFCESTIFTEKIVEVKSIEVETCRETIEVRATKPHCWKLISFLSSTLSRRRCLEKPAMKKFN